VVSRSSFFWLGLCLTSQTRRSSASGRPNPVVQNPNDGILLVWNEVQNFVLTEDLRVDRVADETLPFVTAVGNDFLIAAGEQPR
jgi:hypothetical protein